MNTSCLSPYSFYFNEARVSEVDFPTLIYDSTHLFDERKRKNKNFQEDTRSYTWLHLRRRRTIDRDRRYIVKRMKSQEERLFLYFRRVSRQKLGRHDYTLSFDYHGTISLHTAGKWPHSSHL